MDRTPAVSDHDVVRVFILDDHELVRRGLADLLGSEPDIEIVGEASTARDALHRIPAARPTVALLDARLPDGSGIDVCRDVLASQPDLRCIILTSYAVKLLVAVGLTPIIYGVHALLERWLGLKPLVLGDNGEPLAPPA